MRGQGLPVAVSLQAVARERSAEPSSLNPLRFALERRRSGEGGFDHGAFSL